MKPNPASPETRTPAVSGVFYPCDRLASKPEDLFPNSVISHTTHLKKTRINTNDLPTRIDTHGKTASAQTVGCGIYHSDYIMSDFPEKVSPAKLREYLASGIYSQIEIAKLLGTDRSNINKWANGKIVPELRAVHIATRHIFECQRPLVAKKKPGRPITREKFDLRMAICPHSECIRPNRQMWIAGPPYVHPLLGRIVPVYCSGTHTHKHPRVTRAIDLKGRFWNISRWPIRGALAPWELIGVEKARAAMGSRADQDLLLKALQRCTTALDGTPGCRAFLKYQGLNRVASATARRRLYEFLCSNKDCRRLRWKRRVFDSAGNEVRRNPLGAARLGQRVRRLPYNSRYCPVCKAAGFTVELRFPKQVPEIGGVRYTPALLRAVCENPHRLDHSPPKRKELGLPSGSRSGLTFYYSPKRSVFIDVYVKPLKKGNPHISCRVHGRMRIQTFLRESQLNRIPKDIYVKLGSRLPVKRALCRYKDREVWISGNGEIRIPRALPRPLQRPASERRLARRRLFSF
jgi:DNA-binding XRE family transcriptional regulator